MPFAESNGAEVYYESDGNGDAVVLVAGLASDHRHWARSIPMLKGFRTITVDNRGCGKTRYNGRISMEIMADDVVSVMDAEGVERAHLIGWSMGSHICLSLAARHPERVRTLCLVSSYIHRPARSGYILEAISRAYSEGKVDEATVGAMFNTLIHPEGWFSRLAESGSTARTAEFPPAEDLLNQLLATRDYDPEPDARALDLPVMSVHGLSDIMTEPVFGDDLADAIRGCTRVRIPGEGHFIPQSRYFDDYVKFIRSH